MPLFVKAPGPGRGRASATTARRRSTCFRRSLTSSMPRWIGSSTATRSTTAAPRTRRRGVRPSVEDVLAIAARRAEQFPHGDDWTALAAVGDNGDLVGRRGRRRSRSAQPSRYRASLIQEDLLADLPTADGTMPFVLVGSVAPPDRSTEEPPELARRRERHAGRCRRRIPTRMAPVGSSPDMWPTSTVTAPTRWSCTR